MNVDRWPIQARFWLEWGATLLAKALYDFNIRNYPQLVKKLRYIHQNPVRAELCLRPEDLEWISFRHYATGCEELCRSSRTGVREKRERGQGDSVQLWDC